MRDIFRYNPWIISIGFILICLGQISFFSTPVKAYVPQCGEMIILDSGVYPEAPRIMSALISEDQIIVHTIFIFEKEDAPVCLASLPDKRILVGGGDTIWIVTPKTGSLGAVTSFTHSYFESIIEIVVDSESTAYILDKISDPLGEGYHGAVFFWNIANRNLSYVATDPAFTVLKGMCLEGAGSLLLFDPFAKLYAGGDRNGAIFRIHPALNQVEPVRDIKGFAIDPTDITTSDNSQLIFTDPYIVVPEMIEGHGGLIRINATTGSIIDSLAIEEFVAPKETIILTDGSYVVMDPEAYAHGSSIHGVLFHLESDPLELIETYTHPGFSNLTALNVMRGPEISGSEFSVDDINGGLARGGDRFKYSARLANTGTEAVTDARLEISFDEMICLSGRAMAEGGSFSYSENQNKIYWQGDLLESETIDLSVECRIPPEIESDIEIEVRSKLRAGTYIREFSEVFTTHAQVEPGPTIYLDGGSIDPAPRLFTIDETGIGTTTVFDDPVLMNGAIDVTFGVDGMLYILSGKTLSEKKVIRLDLETGQSEILHQGPPLQIPTAIATSNDGNILVVDAGLDVIHNLPGAIYNLDLVTNNLFSIFEDDDMISPSDICADIEGGYLITDFDSDVGGEGQGAVFEVSGDWEITRALRWSYLEDPFSVVSSASGTFYVADRLFASDPPRGTVHRYLRNNVGGSIGHLELTPAGGETDLVDPSGVDIDRDGLVLVCDRNGAPSGTGGAVFSLTPNESGPWSVNYEAVGLGIIDPARSAVYRKPEVSLVSFQSARTAPGFLSPEDTLIVTANLINDSPMPAVGVDAYFSYSNQMTLLDVNNGEDRNVLVDPTFQNYMWSGNLPFKAPTPIIARFLINKDAQTGDFATVSLEIKGFGEELTASVSDTITAGITGGEVLVLDSQADFSPGGDQPGGLFVMQEGNEILIPHQSLTGVDRALDILLLAHGNLLIVDDLADPMDYGTDTGVVWLFDGEELSVFSADRRFVKPERIIIDPAGGYFLLDSDAQVLSGEQERGVIFHLPEEGGAPTIFSFSPHFRSLVDFCYDNNGNLIVSDVQSDAGGQSGLNPATIFRIDSNGEVDTRMWSSEQIKNPVSIVYAEDKGLIFYDTYYRDPYDNRGVLALNLDTDETTLVVSSPFLSKPQRLFINDEAQVFLVDKAAYTPITLGEYGAIFEINLDDNSITAKAASSSARELRALAVVPAALPRIESFAMAGEPWASVGDTIHCTIELSNPSPTDARDLEVSVNFSEQLELDLASLTASSGELTPVDSGLRWIGVLTNSGPVVINYAVVVDAAVATSSWADQNMVLKPLSGSIQTAQLSVYISKLIGPGDLLVVDSQANPRSLSQLTGAIFRIETPARIPVPILADPAFTTPVEIERIPDSTTEFLVVDSGYQVEGSSGQGGILSASTMTGEVELIFHDSTLVEPRDIQVLDINTVCLLDGLADPLNLSPGEPGPGAIYKVDLTTGTREIIFSDTIVEWPRDMLIDPATGDLILLDAAGDGKDSGGKILRIDPDNGTYSIMYEGFPLAAPRAMTWGRMYEFLVIIDPLASGGQILYLWEDGSIYAVANCAEFYSPATPERFDVLKNPLGRMIIANPGASDDGTIYQLYKNNEEQMVCTTYAIDEALNYPEGIFVYFDDVPVQLDQLALTESSDGVTISWQAPDPVLAADFYIYRKMSYEPDIAYQLLNPDAPISGTGELAYTDFFVTNGETYSYKLFAILPNGSNSEFGPLSIMITQGGLSFGLDRVYPNPSSPLKNGEPIAIRYQTPTAGQIELVIYDVAGRRVRDLVRGPVKAGRHVISWNGLDDNDHPVSSGIYFLKLQKGARVEKRRMVLVQ